MKNETEKTKSILVVDDDKDVLEMTTAILERLFGEFKIDAHEDGESALAAFKKNPESTRLILTDLTMPKISGEDLAEKAREVRADIIIIFMSGYSDQGVGNEVFLAKPVRSQGLKESIEKALNSESKAEC